MKNHIYIFLTLALMLGLWFPHTATAQNSDLAALVAEMQKQITSLQAQIQTLQQQIAETGIVAEPAIEPTLTESLPEFTKTLSRGSSGDEVRKLQEYLAKDKEIYPDGLITGYFGPKTEAALKKWQEKHGIEQVGSLGPKTIAKFKELGKGKIKELITEGAPTAVGGIIPPGLLTAPGIQKKIEIPTTTTATTTVATTTPAKLPPTPGTCAASVNYCFNSDVCSQNGWYWCRNSCYATKDACLGEAYVAPVIPAIPAIPATPAVPAIPAQPISQTSTTTVPATSAIPAVPATVATTTTTTTTNTITVNVKVNGQDSLSNVPYGSVVTLTWTSTGAYSCARDGSQIPLVSGGNWLTNPDILNYTSFSGNVEIYARHANFDYSSVSVLTLGIRCYTPTGPSGSSGYDSVTINLSPPITTVSIPQIQGFAATVSGTSVNLSWQDVTQSTYNLAGSPNNMFGSYNIYRGTSADFVPSPIPSNPTNLVAQGSVLSYTDSNLAAGTYYYKIALQDKNGVVGPASQAVSATIVASADVTPPTISNVNISSTSNTVTVTWSTNEASDSRLQYGLTTAYGSESMFSSLVTSHSVGLSGLPPSTTYHVKIKSQDVAGNTGLSDDYVIATQPFFATLSVSSTPNGAMVSNINSGNVYCQSTPCETYVAVPPNSINIQISKTGYYNWTNLVYIYAGQTTTVNATLLSSATTTSGINFDTASRLAQILESLKSLVSALQSISR